MLAPIKKTLASLAFPAMAGVFALGLASCREDAALDGVTVARLMVESSEVAGGRADPVTLPLSGTVLQVEREPLINEFEIINAEMVKVDLGMALLLQLSPEGTRKLYRASVVGMGRRIILTVNGRAIGARRIDSALTDGNFYTFVELPDAALEQLVIDLKDSVARLQTRKMER